jgi:hypothetical protein
MDACCATVRVIPRRLARAVRIGGNGLPGHPCPPPAELRHLMLSEGQPELSCFRSVFSVSVRRPGYSDLTRNARCAPNQLGVEYNAHVIESILTHVAPALGWR